MFRHQTATFILAILSLLSHPLVSAVQVNVTVDDSQTSNGATVIQYTPSDGWNDGTDCVACTAHPDPTRTLDGTWHDATHEPGAGEDGLNFATLQFDGVAIYVYCVIAHTSSSPDGNSDMTFAMDGKTAGSFLLAPTNQTTYDYNVLVYSNTGLSSGPHTFTLQNGEVGGAKSLVLLDYIVYTHDDGTSPSLAPLPQTSSSSTSLPLQQPSSPTPQTSAPASPTSAPASPTSSSMTFSPGLSSVFSSARISPSHPSSLYELSVTVTSLSTNSGGTVTVVDVLPASTSSSSNPSLADAASHSTMSSKTRTIIIAAVVPSAIILLLALIALIIWCRRRSSRYDYPSPPERDIAEHPESSGWTGDAWDARGDASASNHGQSSHGHSETAILTSSTSPNMTAKTIGRARGLTTSSAVTAISSRSAVTPVSEYSESSTKEYHPNDPTSSGLSYMTEPASRTRHPYAARTPEPADEMDTLFQAPLATVPEMETPAPSSSASHSHPHEPMPAPDSSTQGAGRPRMARPLPARPPASESPTPGARFRRLFRTPSGTSDLPPSYEDITGVRRASQRSVTSIHDTKL